MSAPRNALRKSPKRSPRSNPDSRLRLPTAELRTLLALLSPDHNDPTISTLSSRSRVPLPSIYTVVHRMRAKGYVLTKRVLSRKRFAEKRSLLMKCTLSKKGQILANQWKDFVSALPAEIRKDIGW